LLLLFDADLAAAKWWLAGKTCAPIGASVARSGRGDSLAAAVVGGLSAYHCSAESAHDWIESVVITTVPEWWIVDALLLEARSTSPWRKK
jgi:hypothetical protein